MVTLNPTLTAPTTTTHPQPVLDIKPPPIRVFAWNSSPEWHAAGVEPFDWTDVAKDPQAEAERILKQWPKGCPALLMRNLTALGLFSNPLAEKLAGQLNEYRTIGWFATFWSRLQAGEYTPPGIFCDQEWAGISYWEISPSDQALYIPRGVIDHLGINTYCQTAGIRKNNALARIFSPALSKGYVPVSNYGDSVGRVSGLLPAVEQNGWEIPVSSILEYSPSLYLTSDTDTEVSRVLNVWANCPGGIPWISNPLYAGDRNMTSNGSRWTTIAKKVRSTPGLKMALVWNPNPPLPREVDLMTQFVSGVWRS